MASLISVIECKSPRAKEPIPEAIDQLMRYCEQRDYIKEGNKFFFITISLLLPHAGIKQSLARSLLVLKSIFIAGQTLILKQ